MIFATHEHTTSPCPSCGAPLDASTGVGHTHSPQPGDVTVCAYCARVLIYESTPAGLILREPTFAEAEEILSNPKVTYAVRAVRALIAAKGGAS